MATWKRKQSTHIATTIEISKRAGDEVIVAIDTHKDSDGMRIAHDHIIIPLETLKEMVDAQ